jgi:hypothetical protein
MLKFVHSVLFFNSYSNNLKEILTIYAALLQKIPGTGIRSK